MSIRERRCDVVTDLEVLKRLCSDPLILEHEAAGGVTLADPDDDEPPALPPRPPVDLAALVERLLAEMPLPDGDCGP
jgi:hypothetical protein